MSKNPHDRGVTLIPLPYTGTMIRGFMILAAAVSCILLMRDRPSQKWRCPTTFTAADCATLRAMRLPAALPQAVSNSSADHPRAAMLGFEMFYDARFSRENRVRCASCHLPELSFTDGRAVSVGGIKKLRRNSPSLLTSAWMRTQFWDARTQDLSMQPLQPLMHPDEMGFDPVSLYLRLQKSYRSRFVSVFGDWPEIPSLAEQDPDLLSPGTIAKLRERLNAAERRTLQKIAEQWGDAMESYLRKVAVRESSFDHWLGGNLGQLPPGALRGTAVFLHRGCVECHGGPIFSDEKLHDFNGVGRFRTPTLRNVVTTGPYMHDGRSPTLQKALILHGGGAQLTPGEIADLVAFFETLVGKYPESPWNGWPSR